MRIWRCVTFTYWEKNVCVSDIRRRTITYTRNSQRQTGVIIHDNDLQRYYNVDIGCTIDQADSSLLIKHGVPTFKQFLDWYLHTYGGHKKVILDIKAVVPIEILRFWKRIIEHVQDKDSLLKIQKHFILGLWMPSQKAYIKEHCSFWLNLKNQYNTIHIKIHKWILWAWFGFIDVQCTTCLHGMHQISSHCLNSWRLTKMFTTKQPIFDYFMDC